MFESYLIYENSSSCISVRQRQRGRIGCQLKMKEMKRKTPKEILTASFQELAATKSIDKITIQEIVENCGYSPATFYRYFTDKYDLIAWEHTRSVAEIVDQTGADDYQWKQTLYDGARLYT